MPIAPDRRPQTVAVGEWLALHEALGPLPDGDRGRPSRTERGSGRAPGSEVAAPDLDDADA